MLEVDLVEAWKLGKERPGNGTALILREIVYVHLLNILQVVIMMKMKFNEALCIKPQFESVSVFECKKWCCPMFLH